jgi:hypothetical protein
VNGSIVWNSPVNLFKDPNVLGAVMPVLVTGIEGDPTKPIVLMGKNFKGPRG